MAKQGDGQYYAKSKSVSQQGRGEYYQPTAVIDKQSGKIWRDTMTNVAQSVASAIDKKALQMSEKRKRAEKLMDTTMKYAMERQDSVFENLQKQGVNNPSIVSNFQELLKQEKNTFRESLSARTPAEQDAALEKMAQTKKQMGQLSTLIDQSNESQAMYDKDIQSGNLLGQGTLNLSGEKNTEWAKMMNIRAGINEGTETWGTDKNGEWTVTYDGPELDGPVTQKAALFFGYDPGTIPEIDKFFRKTFIDVGAIDKNGEPTDKYLDAESIIQKTNDPGFNQIAYNVKMGALAMDTSQQTIAYAKAIAGKIPEAEATWDNVFTNSIKEQVAKEFGVKDFDDLKPGSAYGQLDEKSGQMFESALLLHGETQMKNQKLGNVVKVSSKGSGPGSGSGSGSSSITVPDLIKLTSETPAAQQVEMVSANLGPDSGKSVKFHPENNTIIVNEDIIDDDGLKTGEEQVIYDLNQKDNPMGIDPSTGLPGVGGVNQWRARLVDLYAGETGSGSGKAKQVRLQYDMIMNKLSPYPTPSESTTKSLDPKLYLKNYNKRKNK